VGKVKLNVFLSWIWCPSTIIQSINSFQNCFNAKESDIVVASMPKSGTTWLSALTYAIVNRKHFPSFKNDHPLLAFNPHELVPRFEFNLYGDRDGPYFQMDLSTMIEPRLFVTHIPFSSLAKSVKESNCKIIYICRNQFDTFVSNWNFINKIRLKISLPMLTIDEFFEKYCNGISPYGSFRDHMLCYLEESIARPQKILLLNYEDLKEDVNFNIKRIAEFVGFPFTQEEENNGVIENIIKLCSFECMKESKGNQSGTVSTIIEKKNFFRK